MKKLSSLLLLTSMCMFTMSMHAQTPVGYTLFGSNPDGYTDLTASVTAQAIGTAVWDANILTGKGLPGRICETSNYLQMSFNAATTMTLTENYAIHIKLAKVGEAAGDVQLSFCKGGWNAVRVSYIIPNASIGTDATDIVLNYADRNTGNWNSYGEAGTIGTVEYPAGEIFRLGFPAKGLIPETHSGFSVKVHRFLFDHFHNNYGKMLLPPMMKSISQKHVTDHRAAYCYEPQRMILIIALQKISRFVFD